MHPPLVDVQLHTRWMNGHQVIAVTGDIDARTAPVVHAYLLDAADTNRDKGVGVPGDLVVDLNAVTFMDSRGLTTLLAADDCARRTGRHLRLAAPSKPVLRLLAVTHLDLYFDLYLTAQAATSHQADEPEGLQAGRSQPFPPARHPADT